MAKLHGPLLSFGAQGQIGKTLVTSSWRGIKYARQYVTPANPRTVAQQTNRTRFAFLREMYKLAPGTVRDPWIAFAKGRPFTDSNKFVGENNRLLVGESDMLKAIMSPGARGGLPPATVNVTTGAAPGELDVEVTVPDQLPDGWTIKHIAAAAIEDQDPTALFSPPFVAGTVIPPTDTVTLTGLPDGATCTGYGWIVYTRPDGLDAYSVSLSGSAAAGA